MQIHFETEQLNQKEAQGIILLLSVLFPTFESLTTGGLAAPSNPPAASDTQPASGLSLVGNESAPEAAKRTRRTKAQIELDEVQAKLQAAADAGQVAQEGHPEEAALLRQPQTSTTATQTVTKPLGAEELRALLNGFIARHSMEAAIEILKSFGCGRVTEALALDPTKLHQLASQLNA
jgi:hypothetical protein